MPTFGKCATLVMLSVLCTTISGFEYRKPPIEIQMIWNTHTGANTFINYIDKFKEHIPQLYVHNDLIQNASTDILNRPEQEIKIPTIFPKLHKNSTKTVHVRINCESNSQPLQPTHVISNKAGTGSFNFGRQCMDSTNLVVSILSITDDTDTSNINALHRNINGESNGNLIMSPGVLEAGIYQFNVTISIYYEDIIVKYGAHITSFIVNPDCDNVTFIQRYTKLYLYKGIQSYNYGFSYTFIDNDVSYMTYLQSQLLNIPRLDKILLPTGTPSIDSISCSIKVDDNYDWNDNCVSYKNVLINYFNVSTIRQPYEINKYVIYTLYSAGIYINYLLNDIVENDVNIEYLFEYENDAYHCMRNLLLDTLYATYEYFNYDENNFCGNDYSVQLSSLMRGWFDLRKEFGFWQFVMGKNTNNNMKYSKKDIIDNFDEYDAILSLDIEIFRFNSLIEQILDPCDYITENIKQLKFLSVESESIITNQRVIYYKNMDITHKLSPLLLEYEKYGSQLYSFTASVINVLSSLTSIDKNDYYLNIIIDIIDLIRKALYISQLSRISIAIAGENTNIISSDNEFAITSIRYGTSSSNGVNITTPYFDVLITDDDLLKYLSSCENDQSKSNALCNGDVIIIGFNTTQGNNTQFDGLNVGNECNQFTGNGESGSKE